MHYYYLHYRFEVILPGPGTFESLVANEGLKIAERHAGIAIDFPVTIEYDSDLVSIEQWLAEQHIDTFGCSNFKVLSWQPLVGIKRPSSASD
ncbi:hypothetical protein [Pseudomonas amygdali]|uniref:hypothetical protein n=1 Tax=Pseudomonas amygdali TaxID=47877 RepID=UPI000EFF2DA5|nr:hypothetical protein [Pseudomonas amygdali]RMV44833.1 hypothetical protein ALP09_200151 [Pseudomonas amygdali pv. lachrymans]